MVAVARCQEFKSPNLQINRHVCDWLQCLVATKHTVNRCNRSKPTWYVHWHFSVIAILTIFLINWEGLVSVLKHARHFNYIKTLLARVNSLCIAGNEPLLGLKSLATLSFLMFSTCIVRNDLPCSSPCDNWFFPAQETPAALRQPETHRHTHTYKTVRQTECWLGCSFCPKAKPPWGNQVTNNCLNVWPLSSTHPWVLSSWQDVRQITTWQGI